jgi:hypothetical protein
VSELICNLAVFERRDDFPQFQEIYVEYSDPYDPTVVDLRQRK